MTQAPCTAFEASNFTSSATKCKWCGFEEWQHKEFKKFSLLPESSNPIATDHTTLNPSLSIEKEIEVTGQEQSSEIVKELNWLHNKLWATGWKGFTVLESERGALAFHNAYTQLKSNNNFEELEKWVKGEWFGCKEDDMTYHEHVVNADDLLKFIQELKTK